jgi:hypothetical protein
MISKATWKEFRESGLLWWINTQLHLFGWAITFEFNDDEEIVEVYPAKCKFRGFSEDCNSKGYKTLTKYIGKNINRLEEEV